MDDEKLILNDMFVSKKFVLFLFLYLFSNNFNFLKIPGGAVEDSCLLKGAMLNKDIVHPKMKRS